MEKEFKSSKHVLFQIIFTGFPILNALFLVSLILSIFQSKELSAPMQIIWILICLAGIILLWRLTQAFREVNYIIEEKILIYKWGFRKGSIPIKIIKSISAATYPAAGNRPALDLQGLKIIYGEGYSIYISPESQQEFVQTLRDKNRDIKVKF